MLLIPLIPTLSLHLFLVISTSFLFSNAQLQDCWSEKERDATGKLQADHERFPHGIKYLADKVGCAPAI